MTEEVYKKYYEKLEQAYGMSIEEFLNNGGKSETL